MAVEIESELDIKVKSARVRSVAIAPSRLAQFDRFQIQVLGKFDAIQATKAAITVGGCGVVE